MISGLDTVKVCRVWDYEYLLCGYYLIATRQAACNND